MFSDVLDEPSWVGATGVAWGDFDNDGDLDFYAAAENQSNRLFRNDGSDVFTNVATGAIADPEFGIGVSWGDYDNDGDLDLFLAKSWTGTSKLFRNDGGGTFADATSAPIAGLDGMAPVWGDYDNDGDLDLFLSRWGQPSKLFRNEGAGAFVDATTGPLGVAVWGRSAAWGDYDNDGDLDLCWVNWWGQAIRLFRNDGGGAFTEMTSAPLGGADSGSAVAWADYDNDGDLDLYLGNDGTANKLFRNNVGTLNHWLQVKLVGTQSNRSGIGARVIVVGGGKRQIREVSGGSGLFSQDSLVQQFGLGAAMAVDSLIVRWPSGVRQVVLPAPAVNTMVTVTEDSAAFTAVDAGLPGVHWGCAAVWGDYVNDGYLDILLTGWGEGGALTGVYANVGGTGTFVDIGAGLPPLRFSTGAWGDCDGDGDLDLLLAGDTGAGYASNVYRNDAGVFTNMNAGLVGVRYGAAAWGDHDNDGDLDILLMGDTGGGPLTRVYRNDGAGVFTDSGAGLVGLYTGSVAWGDYDRDGDLDVLLTGAMSMGRTSRVYRNDGGGAFTDIGAGLPGVNWSSAAWGDYDSDGDLDILLTGESDSGYLARVYRNEGNGTFTDIGANLPGVVGSSAGWGDYDNDGQLDILLTGSTGAAYISRVYRNGGAGVFTGIGANLAGVWVGSAAWGDYDRDGDLDILLSGDTGAGLTTRIYENNVALANTVPTAPTGLAFHMSGNRLTMNWNAATDSETPAAGLSYNVRLGLVPGGGAIMPALADPASGLRRVAALGNAQQRTAWTVTLPPLPGPYYWSVQAIDGAFAGGPFAPEQSLSLPTAVEDDPVPTEFALRPNMPNPFNPATVIEFNLPHGEAVRLSIYDLKGRRVRCLVDEVKPAGSYRILWNGTDDRGQPLASGVYVCRMEAGSFRETRRMTLVK